MKNSTSLITIAASLLCASLATTASAESYIVKWKDTATLASLKNGAIINGVKVNFFEKQIFGGYSVIKTDVKDDQSKALLASGLFINVSLNKKFVLPKDTPSQAVPVRSTTSTPYKGDASTQSIDLGKYSDPLTENETYLDEQRPYAMGNTSAIAANDILEHNLGRKARVAVLDTGYFPHEDMVLPKDQYNPRVSESYIDDTGHTYSRPLGCITADVTNSGADVVCAAEDMVEITASNNAIDKDWEPSSYVTDENGNTTPVEYQLCINGHGTEVAGAIATKRGNGLGITSFLGADNAEIIPIKIADSCDGGAFTSDIIKGIYWAVGDHVDGVDDISAPVDVINISYGGLGEGRLCDEGFAPLADAVAYANEKGAVVVAATGNDAKDAESNMVSSCHGIISASANDLSGEMTMFTSYYTERKGLSAIGQAVTVPVINQYIYKNHGAVEELGCATADSCYRKINGTSISSPIVAAAAAMVKIQNPQLTPAQIFDVLYNSASTYATNELGDETNLHRYSKNTRLINFKDAVLAAKAYELHVGDVLIEHFGHGKSDAHLQALISDFGKDSVCSKYQLSWKDFYDSEKGMTFNLYGETTTSSVSKSSATLLDTTQLNNAMVDGSYSKYAVEVCDGSHCSGLSEVSLGRATIPNVCM